MLAGKISRVIRVGLHIYAESPVQPAGIKIQINLRIIDLQTATKLLYERIQFLYGAANRNNPKYYRN